MNSNAGGAGSPGVVKGVMIVEEYYPPNELPGHSSTMQKDEDIAAQYRFKIATIEAKLAALTRSMQQIANLDPNHFNAANKAVQMAKTALLIPIPK